MTSSVNVFLFCGGCGKESTPHNLCSSCEEDQKKNLQAPKEDFIPLPEIMDDSPQSMSDRQLRKALQQVDDDRFQLSQYLRGKALTSEDYALRDALDDWAMKVHAEMLRRAR